MPLLRSRRSIFAQHTSAELSCYGKYSVACPINGAPVSGIPCQVGLALLSYATPASGPHRLIQ
jgi:hypothetical protein